MSLPRKPAASVAHVLVAALRGALPLCFAMAMTTFARCRDLASKAEGSRDLPPAAVSQRGLSVTPMGGARRVRVAVLGRLGSVGAMALGWQAGHPGDEAVPSPPCRSSSYGARPRLRARRADRQPSRHGGAVGRAQRRARGMVLGARSAEPLRERPRDA